ncbi:MAG: diguanylate cyclase [Rhodobacter sp.]|uniref:diguanylate cyclase n=1 Tax=Pararhodobacter sp. TaxID=2127056 RepID=UPI002BB68A65|nr:diguanylate cyclase [Pararhodobacter sp.]MCC0073619.1 diguanylate cyclase [Rhodobacter sp.]HPD91730.1 diguanylate cyclase [Pararhodobacter sp.]
MSGKILIVDDLATNRIILKVKLNAAFHETLQAATGRDALDIARREQPKLILLDMMLPDISGIEVCRRLRSLPETQHIPVVIITASGDRANRLKALEAGADEFLTKPLNEVILLARIRSLLRARETEAELRLRSEVWGDLALAEDETIFAMPGRVGLIAAEPAIAIAWRTALAPHLKERLSVLTPAAALSDAAPGAVPDVYMVAGDLGPQGSGLRLVADLRSREPSRHAAIALALHDANPDSAAMALDVGATDLLPLPLDAQETALRLHLHVQRKRRADALRRAVSNGLRLAVTDPLTGLYNRRYALAHLDRIAARARETGRRFAVMVLDLDRFKTVNDTFGHGAGDAVLETVAARLRDNLRPSDLVARIGGEEFLIALPDATLGTARIAAERLCRIIGDEPVPLPDGRGAVQVTISVGLALGPDLGPDEAGQTARNTLSRADAALFAAKTEGRNQVTISSAA